jgi:hypothetical protein
LIKLGEAGFIYQPYGDTAGQEEEVHVKALLGNSGIGRPCIRNYSGKA